LLINLQNEIVLKPGTLLPVAACRGNRKLRGRLSLNLQEKVESHGRGIEAGTEIGGGGRQA